jgi:hypothetical protein
MTTITYDNAKFEHIVPSSTLSPSGTIITHTANDFAIFNNSNSYTVTFHSDAGNISYDPQDHPLSGTIDSVQIVNINGSVEATMTGPFNDNALATVYFNLLDQGPIDALDDLAGDDTEVFGSSGFDELETYGAGTSIFGRGRQDIFFIRDDGCTAIGGPGTNIFHVETPLLGATLTARGESDTIVSDVSFLNFASLGDHINGFRNYAFGPGALFFTVPLNDLHADGTHHIHITGNGGPDSFIVVPPTIGALPSFIDGSHIGVTNFAGPSDAIVWNMAAEKHGVDIQGALKAHNDFVGGKGNDVFIGGNKGDTFFGGLGRNTFDGGHGKNFALFDGPMMDFGILHLENGVNEWRITDKRPGRPDGIDTLVNIQQAHFTDFTIDLTRSGFHVWTNQAHSAGHDLHLWA